MPHVISANAHQVSGVNLKIELPRTASDRSVGPGNDRKLGLGAVVNAEMEELSARARPKRVRHQ